MIAKQQESSPNPSTQASMDLAAGVLPEDYLRLRRMARAKLRQYAYHHSIQATDLVHLAWLKMEDHSTPSDKDTHPESRTGNVKMQFQSPSKVLMAWRGDARKASGYCIFCLLLSFCYICLCCVSAPCLHEYT